MVPNELQVEIAVQDAAGVRIALEGGAARIELCQALGLGGLTPSAGLVEAAVAAAAEAQATGFVHVLVRPRGGGFVYDADERDTIVRDIRLARSLGADGVVVGALTDAGTLDDDAIAEFLNAAEGLDVTVHRAVDASADPLASVLSLAGRGVRRVLTSGGGVDCRAGLPTLARMAAEVGGALEIMSGGGVRVTDIGDLAAAGVDAVHLSARGHDGRGGPSGPGGGIGGFDVTDAAIVRAAVEGAGAAVRASGRRA
ncbi:copper homeostasis protein CutC [Agromyces aureus]|uniref:PF03932 family protein CutC n=1 Tax=Agromyces aureus TaxID=453304 RepID=A0A191WEH9_9MICO|nr:copper homeostasis protein CutC [Agromyces aureus]ANJ26676.1 copper homeostasis protein CutC [Agromyces aureus]